MMNNGMEIKPPRMLDFGFGELAEVSYLEQVFKIKRKTALLYLRSLGINPIHVGEETFFSLVTFKRILFVLSRPGSVGWLAPGSHGKRKEYLRRDSDYITEVTDEILEQAARPEILAEMLLAEGRDPALARKFASPQKGTQKNQKTKNEPGE